MRIRRGMYLALAGAMALSGACGGDDEATVVMMDAALDCDPRSQSVATCYCNTTTGFMSCVATSDPARGRWGITRTAPTGAGSRRPTC